MTFQQRLSDTVQKRRRGQSRGRRPRTLGLFRGDRADAGPASRRHRDRRRAAEVRQAGQGQVREGPGSLLGYSQTKHPSVQQFCVSLCLEGNDIDLDSDNVKP